MNFLEFVQFKNDDIRCRYTSKNGNRRILSTRNSIVLLKGLNKILSKENYSIYEKRGKVYLTTRMQSICIHDYDDFRYDLNRYIPNVVKQIDKLIKKQRIVAARRSALTATVLTGLLCTGLLINPITTNNIDKEQIIIENTLMQDSIKTNEDLERNSYEKVSLNYEEGVVQKAVDDKNTTPTYNYEIDIDCVDKSNDPEIVEIQNYYREIANKVGAKWGVSSNLVLAILTQESHGIDNNLMQIQSWSHKDELMEVFNFDTNQMQKIVITDKPSRYDSDVMTITKEDLNNPFTNISVATIIYRHVLNKYGGNNPIVSIEIYNKGIGNFNKAMDKMEDDTGLSRDEIISTLDSTAFLDYSYVSGQGDPDYVPNVLRYLDGDITIMMIDDNNQPYNISFNVNKTQEKELSR